MRRLLFRSLQRPFLLIFTVQLLTSASLSGSPFSDTSLLLRLQALPKTDNFLPGQVTGLVQAGGGFIFISTQDMGLFRFDGKQYKQFKVNKANPAGVSYNSIYQLYQDRRKRLWLLYGNGEFDIFDPYTEIVRHLSAELKVNEKILKLNGSKQFIPSFWHSRSVFEDDRNRLWLVADEYLACVSDSGLGKMSFCVNIWPDIPASSIRSVNQTASGNLLLITEDGIAEVNRALKIVRHLRLPFKLSDRSNRYYNSMNLRKGNLLYAAFAKGVVVYNIATGSYTIESNLPSTCIDVKTVTSPGNDRLLFYEQSPPKRLFEYKPGRSGFTSLGSFYYTEDILPNEEKFCFLYDRDDNLWHGVFADNIYHSSLKAPPFTIEKVTYDPTMQVLEHLMGMPRTITSRMKIKNGFPIVGTPSGNALYIDTSRKFLPLIPSPYGTNRLKPAPRWTVNVQGNAPLKADDKWMNGELWVLDDAKNQLFAIDTFGQSHALYLKLPPRVVIQSFIRTDKNSAWLVFVNLQGLYLFQAGRGIVRSITQEKGAHPLPDVQFQKIIRDNFNKHIFWLTTAASGVLRFDERDDSWELLGEKEGFTSNFIDSYLQDRLGYFWYTRKSGLYRFDSRNRSHIRVISASQINIPDFDFFGIFGHLLENEIYWINLNYVASIKTDSLPDSKEVSVAITALRVNNQQIEPGDSSGLIPAAINSLSTLKLAHDENFLHFQFNALEFNQPADVIYRYQLVGIDKSWVNNGSLNETQYTSLPPGHYTFKVNATRRDGNWSSEIKSLEVIILPPWWKTWWMYVLYTAAVISALWLFMHSRLRRMKLNQQVLLKQQEADQAQAMEETKSRFFANITHELRTPLTLIMSPIQRQLQEGSSTWSPALLSGVYRNSQILLRLINQLLDMSKLESNQMSLTLSRGSLVQFIDELLNAFRQQALARNINLNYTHDDLSEDLVFDSDKLEKIIYNLLSNAFKFTADAGAINIHLKLSAAEASTADVVISVTDTGIGIAPDHLPHIFDRFYQVNTSTTRRYEGTGIGLALVKELVDLMKGNIQVSSTAGKGSTFHIALPLARAGEQTGIPQVNLRMAASNVQTVAPASSETTSVTSSVRTRILITDDNDDLRRFLADSLSPYYEVLMAANGKEGFEVSVNELPELIISDVMMPVMDGYEFCEKIKQTSLTSHIGFIMLTAKTAGESRLSGLRLGADHYLSKPFAVEELLLTVANLLTRQQKLKDHYSGQLQPSGKLPAINEVEDKFLQAVYTVIEENLDSDQLNVDFLATQMAVSRRTLNRRLAAIGDTSANEVIRNYRLKKAASLLLTGEGVSRVAYATGFSTPSWFSQCFKELYGVTPVNYAENGGLPQK